MEKLKQICLTTSLSHHNCQASYTSALHFAENGAPFFFHTYIRQGGHHAVLRATASSYVS